MMRVLSMGSGIMNTLIKLCVLLAACSAAPSLAAIPVKIYAQYLVDEVAAKNPDLLIIAMHVTPPKATENIIIASNIGRIGKVGDEDDMRIINTGKTNLEVSEDGGRFEVALVLQDISGQTIGALGLVYPYHPGVDKLALQRKSERIQSELRRHILNTANLMEPYLFDPLFTTTNHAQKILDRTYAKYPDLLSLAMHVSPPKATNYPILASTFGRQGKPADADDLNVINGGKTVAQLNSGAPNRLGAAMPLHDAAGKLIGSLNMILPYRQGDDSAKLTARAERIRDEIQQQIASVDELVKLDP
jgi:hypothetical protein